ncbi:MAG: MvdC/MvdD family ATP grasp protein, partial [Pseudonocardiaceae bacterium]
MSTARFDLGAFPLDVQLAATHDGHRWSGRLTGHDTSVELDEVCSVYYRRPSQFTFPPEMSTADRAYAACSPRSTPIPVPEGGVGVMFEEPSSTKHGGAFEDPGGSAQGPSWRCCGSLAPVPPKTAGLRAAHRRGRRPRDCGRPAQEDEVVSRRSCALRARPRAYRAGAFRRFGASVRGLIARVGQPVHHIHAHDRRRRPM